MGNEIMRNNTKLILLIELFSTVLGTVYLGKYAHFISCDASTEISVITALCTSGNTGDCAKDRHTGIACEKLPELAKRGKKSSHYGQKGDMTKCPQGYFVQKFCGSGHDGKCGSPKKTQRFDCFDFGKVTTGDNGVTIWATYGTWANCPEGYAVTGICSSDWKA